MNNLIKFLISIILILLIFYFHKQYENFNVGRCYDNKTGFEKVIQKNGTCANFCYCFNGNPNPPIDSNINECDIKSKQYCYKCDKGYTLNGNLCLDENGLSQELEEGVEISDMESDDVSQELEEVVEISDMELVVSDSGLVAHYKFDNSILDSSGNGNHLTIYSGTPNYVDDYLNANNDVKFSINNPQNIIKQGQTEISICFSINNLTTIGYVMRYRPSNIYIWYDGNTNIQGFVEGSYVYHNIGDITSWKHLTFVFKDEDYKIYIDGVFISTAVYSGSGTLDDGFTHDTNDNVFGILHNGGGTGLSADIKDLRFYNRALVATEVLNVATLSINNTITPQIIDSSYKYLTFPYIPPIELVYDFHPHNTSASVWTNYANSIPNSSAVGTSTYTDYSTVGGGGGVWTSPGAAYFQMELPLEYNTASITYSNPQGSGSGNIVRILVNNVVMDSIPHSTEKTFVFNYTTATTLKIDEVSSIIGTDIVIKLSKPQYTVNFPQETICDILIVAGGGGGGGREGYNGGGGGGAGEVLEKSVLLNGIYNIKVGKGGTVQSSINEPPKEGSDSGIFSNNTAVYHCKGGGRGGFGQRSSGKLWPPTSGGSGGGSERGPSGGQPSTKYNIDGKGNAGRDHLGVDAGGGGGAGAAGTGNTRNPGSGYNSFITGVSTSYASGGYGGWQYSQNYSDDGLGSGGAGAMSTKNNTSFLAGEIGNSGIVIIKYKYIEPSAEKAAEAHEAAEALAAAEAEEAEEALEAAEAQEAAEALAAAEAAAEEAALVLAQVPEEIIEIYNYDFDNDNGNYSITFEKNVICDILVVAGGGGGGASAGGGGGAGGLIFETNVEINQGTYSVFVGKGGGPNKNGSDSSFNSISATGGGKGSNMSNIAGNGGSGGGGQRNHGNLGKISSPWHVNYPGKPGGTGISDQGNNGGEGKNKHGYDSAGGGGGGAGEIGQSAFVRGKAGKGGIGLSGKDSIDFKQHFNLDITVQIGDYIKDEDAIYFAGGGGGGNSKNYGVQTNGGFGGGGMGEKWANNGHDADVNTGGGGGGGSSAHGQGRSGGSGGSGIVIIKYR